jgi:hypothetical protein
MSDAISYRFLVRGGAASAVHALNEIPKSREIVIETDTLKMKVGDGATPYLDLPYFSGGGGSGVITVPGPPGTDIGDDGDYALWPHATAPMLYGPKAMGEWPAGIPLRGAPGPSSSCFPTASFDGGTGDIQVGAWCEVFVPFGFTVRSWTLVGDALGTISIDVQPASFSAYPPTAASSICGGNPPKLLGDNKATDSALTGWTPSVPSGSVIRFVVTASGGINRATLTLNGERT